MFKNTQWQVTKLGLESRPPDPDYVIPARDILAVRDGDGGPVYEFLADVPAKTWVRVEEFVEAFKEAATFHARSTPTKHVDAQILARSIDEACNRAKPLKKSKPQKIAGP